MGNRLTIRDEGEGRICIYLRRAGQEFPERASDPFPFTFPISDQERKDLRWYLEDYLLAPYAVWEDQGQAIADKFESWGEVLFESVFGSVDTHSAYVKAREGSAGAELVIHSSSPSFLGLPWELLKDPKRPTPLSLDTSFVAIDRTLDVGGEATEVPSGETLRVLMVIARPAGIEDVGYQMIARPLLERREEVRGRVDLEVLRPPTFDALETRLKRAAEDGQPYHVLHFDGHGVLQRAASAGFASGTLSPDRFRYDGEGFLVFEKPTGGGDPIKAEHFARIIRTGRVPVVVLNACKSGAMAEAAEAALATRLLLEGAASVVAMGYSVYAIAAAEFMTAFYEALFEGKAVSAAVRAGRDRLARKADRPSPKGPTPLKDWIVPVHYLRRAVAFPQLRSSPARAGISLDSALDRMRQAPKAGTLAKDAQVQPECSIEPVGRFVGRDSFIYTLEVASRHDRVVLVHGQGGTGKTELAKAFARWWRDTGGLEDPEYLFFHSFEPGLPSFTLDRVVNVLGIRLFGSDFIGRTEGMEQRREIVLETLRQHRMLLIWDNLESVFEMPDPGGATPPLSPEQRQEIMEFLSAFRSPGGHSVLILTSRTKEEWLGNVRRVPVGGFTSLEASEYADDLLAAYPLAQTRRKVKAFGELMEWLAGHPLSLRLILPGLQQTNAAALLACLRGMSELPRACEAGVDRLQSLDASVKYSLDHLPENVRRLLPALSLLEGAADVRALTALSMQREAPARFAGATIETWQAALAETARVGLLTPIGGGQYSLHPALPIYLAAHWRQEAGEDFEAEWQSARRGLMAAYADFAIWLSRQLEGGSAETARVLIERQRRTMGRMVGYALAEKQYRDAQQILEPLNEAGGWADRVREAVEGPGGTPPDLDTDAWTLWLYVVVGEAIAFMLAGDLSTAERTFDALRRILEAAPPGDIRDRHLADIYINLGNVAERRSNLTAAEEWCKQSLAIREALGDRPDDRSSLAVSYDELGVIAQLRGDLTAAEEWYRKSLAIKKALGNCSRVADTYYQLGLVAHDRGDFTAAEKWCQQSLAIKDALGDREGMSSNYHQLGVIAQLRGDLTAAEEWYRKSLVIHEALGNRPDMSMSYHQLGTVAQLRGDFAAAEEWYRKSLVIKEALGNRRGMASSYHQFGTVAQLRGDLAAAEEWCRKSLAIREALGDLRGMAQSYGNLGLLALQRDDPSSALDWWVRCVALFDDFPHPMTGSTPRLLAQLTGMLGMAALEESWPRCAGRPLPEPVRAGVERIIRGRGLTEG